MEEFVRSSSSSLDPLVSSELTNLLSPGIFSYGFLPYRSSHRSGLRGLPAAQPRSHLGDPLVRRASSSSSSSFPLRDLEAELFSSFFHTSSSRKSQSQRTKAADEFKLARCGVLFSSDVTARGIDVPGVTSVLQVGLPASAEQYTHRLGRTARAGASGHGTLILTASESFFLKKRDVMGLGLKEMEGARTEMAGNGLVDERQKINKVLDTIGNEAKAQGES